MEASCDFWDIISLIATLSTGIVIAIAASLAFFVQRSRYIREIEVVLTRGGAVSGIGNAYADKMLFAAGLFPLKQQTTRSKDSF